MIIIIENLHGLTWGGRGYSHRHGANSGENNTYSQRECGNNVFNIDITKKIYELTVFNIERTEKISFNNVIEES
jgi:hypothetical protein